MESGRIKASARTVPASGVELGRSSAPENAKETNILDWVDEYLAKTEGRYERGDDQYYARICLREAAQAFRAGNYGIGSVVVMVGDDHIAEFRQGNRMITGQGVIDHAETLAVLAANNSECTPNDVYRRDLNDKTAQLETGLHLFGTLEPCPMCACVATNSRVVRSVSTVTDGDPTYERAQLVGSTGGATVLGEKAQLQPVVWRNIQAKLGLTFELLQTEDLALRSLSHDIFTLTRSEIDQRLATRMTGRQNPGFSGQTLG